jgi:hypothetical protein
MTIARRFRDAVLNKGFFAFSVYCQPLQGHCQMNVKTMMCFATERTSLGLANHNRDRVTVTAPLPIPAVSPQLVLRPAV